MRITELFTAQSIALDEALQTQEEILSRLVELQATQLSPFAIRQGVSTKALLLREGHFAWMTGHGAHAKDRGNTLPEMPLCVFGQSRCSAGR